MVLELLSTSLSEESDRSRGIVRHTSFRCSCTDRSVGGVLSEKRCVDEFKAYQHLLVWSHIDYRRLFVEESDSFQ